MLDLSIEDTDYKYLMYAINFFTAHCPKGRTSQERYLNFTAKNRMHGIALRLEALHCKQEAKELLTRAEQIGKILDKQGRTEP